MRPVGPRLPGSTFILPQFVKSVGGKKTDTALTRVLGRFNGLRSSGLPSSAVAAHKQARCPPAERRSALGDPDQSCSPQRAPSPSECPSSGCGASRTAVNRLREPGRTAKTV